MLSATLQAGDLIDQVDRERGANRNQSREIQLIHAKRLTHHPNTRYTLLVMDSCISIFCQNPMHNNGVTRLKVEEFPIHLL